MCLLRLRPECGTRPTLYHNKPGRSTQRHNSGAGRRIVLRLIYGAFGHVFGVSGSLIEAICLAAVMCAQSMWNQSAGGSLLGLEPGVEPGSAVVWSVAGPSLICPPPLSPVESREPGGHTA
uniref:Uncharacterized protein n=1 Tax=Knipowitschia caucasica TaxID=637954 RepID=A0AAV2K7C9_KNICA